VHALIFAGKLHFPIIPVLHRPDNGVNMDRGEMWDVLNCESRGFYRMRNGLGKTVSDFPNLSGGDILYRERRMVWTLSAMHSMVDPCYG
jgi:hypothetical protein